MWVSLVLATAEGTEEVTIGTVLAEASGMVLAVLVILVLASVISWFIIGFKWLSLARASHQSRQFTEAFWDSKRFDAIYDTAKRLDRSPVSKVFQAGYVELRKLKSQSGEGTMSTQLEGTENVERALRRAISTEVAAMESLIPFLATVGSTAPFVGLFGTVWGIMIAFLNLSNAGPDADMSINIVAGPIAEALIATAIGLMAAIPAVVAYNFLNARISSLSVEMDNFSNDFLNIVRRHFIK
ncbi:MAG: protein TolQ [Myxococcales bacterium]|nr:protein TolQ [Myxococcales bacterium]